MKTRLSLGLGLLVVLLIAGHATAASVLITMDEYGTVLVTQDSVTRQPTVGLPIAGGGITYRWRSFVDTGDISSGTVFLVDGQKTRAVFDRYHIVSRADRKAAVALLNGDNRSVRLETRRATR